MRSNQSYLELTDIDARANRMRVRTHCWVCCWQPVSKNPSAWGSTSIISIWIRRMDRFLTFTENILFGAKLSEYHTGYRAFSREILERLNLDANSDDFIFDNQMLAQVLWHGFTIAEVSCPTKYFSEASSINLRRSIRYGFGCLATALAYRMAKMGLLHPRLFPLDMGQSRHSSPALPE